MKPITSFVQRNSLVTFVVLAYLLSWWPVPLTGGNLLLPHGPMLAALLVLWLGEGTVGVKSWWSRVVQRRAAWYWYVIAAAIPVVITFTAAGLNVLMGAQLPAQIDWTIPFQVLPVMLLVSGMWEEPGWTGFALPRLFERFGPSAAGTMTATLIMALIRTGWHLPLMFSGSIYWSDIVLILAVQIVIAWLFNATARKAASGVPNAAKGGAQKAAAGSVLTIMLLHLLNNTISGEFVQQWFTGADWVRQSWLLAGLWTLLAVGVLLATGFNLGRKSATEADVAAAGQPAPAR
jgi:membrane protease YdiL (CAAX protease family)